MRERLIGAIILVIVAIILIPWLVSRAHHPRQVVRQLPVPASVSGGEQHYVMPLSASAAAPVRNAPAAHRVPTQATQSQAHAVPSAGAVPARSTTSAAAARESAPKGATAPGWHIQVASFTSRKAAEGLVARLSKAGFTADLSPNTVGKTTYYRVWVGPYESAERAKAAAAKVSAVSGTKVLIRQPGAGQ